jgi:hypothetical protein
MKWSSAYSLKWGIDEMQTGSGQCELLTMTGDPQARKRARAPWRMMPELSGDETKALEWKELNDQGPGKVVHAV